MSCLWEFFQNLLMYFADMDFEHATCIQNIGAHGYGFLHRTEATVSELRFNQFLEIHYLPTQALHVKNPQVSFGKAVTSEFYVYEFL